MFSLFGGALRAIGGVIGAMLPRRWWPVLDDYVPASNAALAASVLTLLAGAALGITGFLGHLTEAASLTNDAFLATATRNPGEKIALPSGLSIFSFVTFLFLTPQGWAATYLTLSGAVRAIGTRVDDPHGDFLLTLVDAGARSLTGRAHAAADIRRRRRREGPIVPDRVLPGGQVGLPDATLVIVASTPKVGWQHGAVVLSDAGEFRLVAVEDREIDGRLRHLYGLARHADHEVFRRTVEYEFSPAARLILERQRPSTDSSGPAR